MAQRILIVGSCAAGKSTLGAALATRLALPLVHLDQHYWRPGWIEPSTEDWRAQVAGLVAEPRWVMDGNYGGTLDIRLPRADRIVLLDQPRRLTLYRAVRRRVLRNRVDELYGSPERITWPFLKWIWDYPARGRRILLEAIAEYAPGTEFVRLRGPDEVTAWLAAQPESGEGLARKTAGTRRSSR
ncbi:adenylate kinase [Phytomonospora sp. NPDC050363]|uniref:adenylate kinase n=1 Tax=Phytomonospora sp. NPDC050363 TaxID=3155642 RepID=UPI0033E5AA60